MSEQPRSLPPVEFRPAAASDWPYVERIVEATWDGEDYITEELWNLWLNDAQGYLAVGTIAGRLVVVGRITEVGPSEWWLEGLRVHPKGQGQGLGTAITDHLVNWFKRHGEGLLRLSIYSDNEASRRLVERQGFHQILSYRRMTVEPASTEYHDFKLLEPQNLDMVDSYLKRSPMFRLNHFSEHYWEMAYLTRERIGKYLRDDSVEVLGWRQGEKLAGLAIIFLTPPPGRQQHPGEMDVGYLDAGDDTTVGAMVQALRGLAAARGDHVVLWKMPTGMGLEKAVGEVGMQPDPEWVDGTLMLYERPINA